MQEKQYKTDENVLILPGAAVYGEVAFGSGCSVWFNAVIRGDEAPITVGDNTNVQDCAVLHVDENCPLRIGSGVTVGHGAILHGCTIGDNTLIGMGAIILNGARIGKNCIIGAGALVSGKTEIPDGWMAYGNPAKPVRRLRPAEIESNRQNCEKYLREKERYRP